MRSGGVSEYNGFDHINRNPPVLIRTPKLTRFEPAQYWGGGPPGNSVVLNPFFFLLKPFFFLSVCPCSLYALCATLIWDCSPVRRKRVCLSCVSICGRVVKALRSGRSQLCWRGFESHRMYTFFFLLFLLGRRRKKLAVPGFEPGSSGSQPLMLTTTLYHHNRVLWSEGKK